MSSRESELRAGDGRLFKPSNIAQVYRETVNIPIPTAGWIHRTGGNHYSVTSQFSAVDCDILEKTQQLKVYSLTTKKEGKQTRVDEILCVSQAHEVTEIISVTSENGRYTARLKRASPDVPKKQLLEIWERGKHLRTIDTSISKFHGLICTDSTFSSFQWSKTGQQDKLLYVSVPRGRKEASHFKEQDIDNGDETPLSQQVDMSYPGSEYVRQEDWGEDLEGVDHTVLAVLEVGNNFNVTIVDIQDYSLATPQWLDDDNKIVFTGYQESPRRIGLKHYNSRPSKLMVYDLQQQKKTFEFASGKDCFHTPRASNKGDKFVYLSNTIFGPHKRSNNICICDIKTGTNNILMSELFIDTLAQNPFTSDDSHILFVKTVGLYRVMSLIDVRNSEMYTVNFPTTGLSLLDFRYDIILASGSEVNASPTIYVGMVDPKRPRDVTPWHQLEECVHLGEVEYETLDIHTEDKSALLSALLVTPNLTTLREIFPGYHPDPDGLIHSKNKLPTLIMIHGGPHSVSVAEYRTSTTFFARLGMNSLLINYRGSTGVTEDHTSILCGRAGELDVSDCMSMIRFVVKNGMINPKKMVLYGGSHGGFLACHLSCQQEFRFISAIVRNPVVDMASLYTLSDIPDWCFAEGLGHDRYHPAWVPSPKELQQLYIKSPIFKADQAYVPTLVLLGSQDRRVPMSQGERWFDILKAQSVSCECKIYPDKHDLGKTKVAADSSVESALWIMEHLPETY